MEVVHPRCCGIDVHQASLAVCVVIKENGKSEKHKLRCGSTTAELLRLADWLHGHQVTNVAMEATGVYWKPVWHILEGQFELLLANPTQVQALRGRKTDLKDGERISDFLQHGLLQGSFVPPQPIQQLRDLTRSRTTLKRKACDATLVECFGPTGPLYGWPTIRSENPVCASWIHRPVVPWRTMSICDSGQIAGSSTC
jgi:hypothetical protein